MNNEESNIIVKKKRGRKPKNVTGENKEAVVKIPKKRGRKPKIKIISEEEKNKFVLPSKRGRKPKDKGIHKDVKLDEITNTVLHLPISKMILDKLDSIDKNEINYPIPYDPNKSVVENYNLCDINDTSNYSEIYNNNDTKVYTEINQSYYIKKYNELTMSNVKCNWCFFECNEKNIYRIPYNIVNGEFQMYGNFCCPECASAYNFEDIKDEYVWERYSLINYLYGDENKKMGIAPSRFVLNIFGGPLTMEEYKDIINTNKKIKIIMPPFYIICPQVEVSQKQTNNNIFIPLNINRINKYTNELKLKRTQPIKKTNTLESCMNLKCI